MTTNGDQITNTLAFLTEINTILALGRTPEGIATFQDRISRTDADTLHQLHVFRPFLDLVESAVKVNVTKTALRTMFRRPP